ncbi:MAG: hypothetical protein R3B90_07720 [Planctomycetaceae bacterium]
MQSFSRVLAVLVAVASVVFMGFAGVVSFGGPNWEAEARSLEGYTFDQEPGQPPIWSATRSLGEERLSPTSPLLPEVLVAAYQDRTRRAGEELQTLEGAIPRLQTNTAQLQQMQDADRAALERAFAARTTRLKATRDQIDQLSQQHQQVEADALQVEDRLKSRREDVFRLQLQYRLLEADLYQVDQNIDEVAEQIRLLEDELDKASRRQAEMDARGLPPAE